MKVTHRSISKSQIERVADMSSDLGVACLISVVFPAVTTGFSLSPIIGGSVVSFSFLFMSFKLSK